MKPQQKAFQCLLSARLAFSVLSVSRVTTCLWVLPNILPGAYLCHVPSVKASCPVAERSLAQILSAHGFCSPAHLGPFVFVMSSPIQHPRPRLKGRLCAPSNPSKPNTSHRPLNTGALFFTPVAQDLSSNVDYSSHFLLDSILSDRNWRNQKRKLFFFCAGKWSYHLFTVSS